MHSGQSCHRLPIRSGVYTDFEPPVDELFRVFYPTRPALRMRRGCLPGKQSLQNLHTSPSPGTLFCTVVRHCFNARSQVICIVVSVTLWISKFWIDELLNTKNKKLREGGNLTYPLLSHFPLDVCCDRAYSSFD
jgi:hypothetical protein